MMFTQKEASPQATQLSVYSKLEGKWIVLENLQSKFEKEQMLIKEEISNLKQVFDSETNAMESELSQLANLRLAKKCLDQSNSKIRPILEMVQSEFIYLQEQVTDLGKQLNFKHLIKNASAQLDLVRKIRFQKYDNLIKTMRDDTKSRYDIEKNKADSVEEQIDDFQSKLAKLHFTMNEMSKISDHFQTTCNLSLEKIEEFTVLNDQLDQLIKPLEKKEEALRQEMQALIEKITTLMKQNEHQFREYSSNLILIEQTLASNEQQMVEAIKERKLLNDTINQINVDLIQIDEQLLKLSKEDEKRSVHRQTLRTLNEKVLKELNQEISSIERLHCEEVNWRECIEAGQTSFEKFRLARKESSKLNGKQELELMKEMLDEKKMVSEQRRSELKVKQEMVSKEKEKLLQVETDLEDFQKHSNKVLEQIDREKSQVEQDLAQGKAKKAVLFEEVTKLREEYQELIADNQTKKEEIAKKEMLLEAFALIEGLRRTDNDQPSFENANQPPEEDDKSNQCENLDSPLASQITEENLSSLEITTNESSKPIQDEPSSLVNADDKSIAGQIFDPASYFENTAIPKSPCKRKVSKFFISRSSDESNDDPESKLRRISFKYDSILNTKKTLPRKSTAKPKVTESRKKL